MGKGVLITLTLKLELITKKVKQFGAVENYENSIRLDGIIAQMQRFNFKLNAVIEKSDKLDELGFFGTQMKSETLVINNNKADYEF
ncbi:hypothetical protein [Paenibacillus sp. DMB5]|uniref:hypothetical protein n=1 Tax=Paenibacillus sp. DMB5 TaxID=1780103 RepID=UPI00076C62C8|nr:hypothetical protein [Paenibacillus sp. DMB5]KUP21135.1 hypothetical protein AWJ19_07990 [Paenibacillus sp. DMB5]